MKELENVVSAPYKLPDEEGFYEDYYVLRYHIPGQFYTSKHFHSRDDLIRFIDSITPQADFFSAEYYLMWTLNSKKLLKEAKNK